MVSQNYSGKSGKVTLFHPRRFATQLIRAGFGFSSPAAGRGLRSAKDLNCRRILRSSNSRELLVLFRGSFFEELGSSDSVRNVRFDAALPLPDAIEPLRAGRG